MIILFASGLAAAFAAAASEPAAPAIQGARLQPHAVEGRAAGFRGVSSANSGVSFTHHIPSARSLTNQMLLDGAGVALADVDGDGRIDIFFGASGGGSQLWRNLGGWRFEQITASAFPTREQALAGDITGAAFADLNGDGKPDLVVNSHAHGVRILTNSGHATFHAAPLKQGRARGGHSVALADIDGDGWPDIYVCNYRERALMDMPSARATFQTVNGVSTVATLNGRPASAPDLTNRFIVSPSGELAELGEPDLIYQNHGGTNFAELGWTSGNFLDEDGRPLSAPPFDWGLAAQFCDINGDGRPDLYVCNDFHSPDRLWLNESTPGRVRLRLAPRNTLRHTSLFSMGVDFADINRDGRWDMAVLDMLSPDHERRLTALGGTGAVNNDFLDRLARPQVSANTLFVQRADGSFYEAANFAGIVATDWSWTPAFLDVDLDGWPDLLVTAGQERGSRDLDLAEHMKAFRRTGLRTDAQIFRERQKFPRQPAPLKAFRNRGAGAVPGFVDASAEWSFDDDGVSHGMALADLDGDGDLDVVVNHLEAPAGLFENVSTAPRISVRLKGRAPNTAALGAELRFWWDEGGSNSLAQTSQITGGGRYLSSDDFSKTFACGKSGRGTLEIRWPSGEWTRQANLEANRYYEINESGSERSPPPGPPPPGRLKFEAMPPGLAWTNRAPIDFNVEPSLPRLQSTRSPALALSTNETGAQLWIGTPRSILQVPCSPALAPVREAGKLSFARALVPWQHGLIVATEAWQANVRTSRVVLLDPRNGAESLIPVRVPAAASLAVDAAAAKLFVGGGTVPGEYPRSVSSEVLHWNGQAFQSAGAADLGIVTAAAFAELDGAPGAELITVSEWGAPRLFRGGNLEQDWNPPVWFEGSAPTPLGQLAGWWQALSAADLDGDGRNDLLLGNWGLNSSYALYTGPASPQGGEIRPLALYHQQLAPGTTICLEAYTAADGRTRPIHGLSELSRHLPWATESFPTYKSFAAADVSQVLGDKVSPRSRLECRWLASLALLNRGDHFEAAPLPALAQLGPIFAFQAADFDGDGVLDVYCAQGFFGHNFAVARDDAGEGVFLLGKKTGGFDALSTAEAGFRLLGEQRAALARDLDGDGKPDLVVGEYGGPVTVLLNRKP